MEKLAAAGRERPGGEDRKGGMEAAQLGHPARDHNRGSGTVWSRPEASLLYKFCRPIFPPSR